MDEEEENGDEEKGDGETAAGDAEGATATPAGQPVKVEEKKSSRETIRELDGKIAKYKQFLDRARLKRFSAIRFVLFFSVLPTTYHFSLVLKMCFIIF